ncbi:MAG: SPFH domain-containing protein [Sedimentisphaerales bacterium]|jgi:regulator of protease activity HflC (stomatin/prohibitin superfamily)
MTTSSRPAKLVAVVSLILSVIFFVIMVLLGQWSGFVAIYSAGFVSLGAALIWLVLLIQFHQRNLAEQEKLDMSALAGDHRTDKIFQAKGEQSQLFAVAQKRLAILEKWFLPVFSFLIAAYQVAIGLYLLKAVSDSNPAIGKQPLLCAVCMVAIAFVSFLLSRYATGMSNQAEWKPLRAGGSFLFGSAILSFALAIALALVQFKIITVISVIDYSIPVLLIVLGVENLLNIIFDIYRPRLTGLYSRAAFDSRLLGLINEPGEILHTATGAIDYQFGFKVSQTWFYKLLEKAVVPLIFFGAITLYLLSGVVVINSYEQAVIERFGNPKDAKGDVRLIGPGIHFKMPWPIDIARIYPAGNIEELQIGYVPKTDPKTGQVIREPLLWGKDHYKEEYSILIASRLGAEKNSPGAAPVSLLKANVPVQFRVKDLYAFLYNQDNPQKRLENICYRELARFAAGASIEVDDEAALQTSLLGAGRAQAKQVLTKNIQAAADKAGLGVEIVFVGLQGIHPPTQVAADYEKVVGAVQMKQAIILQAQAQRNRTLSTLAGSVDGASDLFILAADYQKARQENNRQKTDEIAGRLDTAFTQADGDIFCTLREAQSYSFERVAIARSTGERFDSQVKAYRAAPEIYKKEQRLLALEETLSPIRKYVIVADPNDAETFIVDLKEKLTPSLYDIGGVQESSSQ